MGNWNPDIMLNEKRNIDEAIERMENLNEQLLSNLSVYSTTMQDDISSQVKEMIMKIDTLLKDIREKVSSQAQFVEIGAIGLAQVEASAENIKNLKN